MRLKEVLPLRREEKRHNFIAWIVSILPRLSFLVEAIRIEDSSQQM
jgi:hypothetical protein